jgi:Flp pilus assembly pilin Flp
MLALIIVVCLTAISVLGGNANKTFSNVASAIGT